MQGDIFSSEVKTKQAEFYRISKQPRDFTVKEITFFDGNLCFYHFVIDFFFVFSLVWEKCYKTCSNSVGLTLLNSPDSSSMR